MAPGINGTRAARETVVKVCGIREPAHALAALQAGADFIGMILAPSRRRITVNEAARIVAAVKGASVSPPRLVGVFVDAPEEEVNRAAHEAGLDFVQLSGREDEDYLERMEVPAIKTVHVPSRMPDPVAWLSIKRRLSGLTALGVIPHLDTLVDGQAGGTGQAFDWSVAAQGVGLIDYLLAGGLTPENVAGAIARLHPWGVDVSSGVETNGVKDPAKIAAFVRAAKAANP
jgi:phosphoribosylanthranilate isomerase